MGSLGGHVRWLFLVLSAVMGIEHASAREWVVSNSGVDSATCGSFADSCRTISQAIANASNGDLIAVGPGQYGNVSGNPAYGGPADERPGPMDVFTGCALCVDKAVTIISFAGAAETVLQGNVKATLYPAVIGIEHDGVTFGTPGHGFTITGGTYGVAVAESCQVMTANVSIAGNVDTNDTVGFEFYGLDQNGLGTCATRTAQVWLLNNTAINNPQGGFVVVTNLFENEVILKKNLVMGSAGSGFYVDPGGQNNDFNPYAGKVMLLNNVAISSYYGFWLDQIGTAQYNTATNNVAAGFVLDGDIQGPLFTVFNHNAAVGNHGPGVIVFPESFSTPSGFADFSHNDFIGNDRDRTVTLLSLSGSTLKIGPSAHCGLLNTGLSIFGGAFGATGGKLQSLYDFWGTSQGPQAKGPGDDARRVCDKNGAVTTVVPFSTSAYVFTSVEPLLQ